jgi:CheY-like chemotaxis protein
MSHPAPELSARRQEYPIRRSFNILLVDDNPVDVRIVAEGLREALPEAKLSVAKDGLEAISFLHQAGKYANSPRPDLILLDLRLPKKSGFEVLREVKQDPVLATIPVVVHSSSEEKEDIQKAYSLHANCYIAKPDTLDEFSWSMKILADFWLTAVKLPQGEDWKAI